MAMKWARSPEHSEATLGWPDRLAPTLQKSDRIAASGGAVRFARSSHLFDDRSVFPPISVTLRHLHLSSPRRNSSVVHADATHQSSTGRTGQAAKSSLVIEFAKQVWQASQRSTVLRLQQFDGFGERFVAFGGRRLLVLVVLDGLAYGYGGDDGAVLDFLAGRALELGYGEQ